MPALLILFGLLSLTATAADPSPVQAQVAVDDKQAEISRLLDKALTCPRPEEQIEIYRKILQLDPNNQNAFTGAEKARQAIADRAKDREKTVAEEASHAQQERRRQEAIRAAEAAVALGNADSAKSALDALRGIAPNDANLSRLDRDVQALAAYRRVLWMCWASVAGLFSLSGAAAVFHRRGRRIPCLEVIEGAEAGRAFTLEKDAISIGSAVEHEGVPNDIRLSDELGRIAKRHCEIHRAKDAWWVIDCFTADGTLVDGRRIDPPDKAVQLKPGSVLNLGDAAKLNLRFDRKRS